MQSVNGLKQHTTNSGQKVLLPFGHLFSLDVLDVLPPYPYIILKFSVYITQMVPPTNMNISKAVNARAMTFHRCSDDLLRCRK